MQMGVRCEKFTSTLDRIEIIKINLPIHTPLLTPS